ncbi:MAG TPA: M56 family metallopeptidase [Thermoanaerobaculia bacterium]|nr:M56 family metallopeptidase [Thermoanaerobaculia bacterium]
MLDLWFAALLDVSAKGFALCLAALAVTSTLRRASAATRHLVWRLAFVGLLVLPVLAAFTPAWRVELPLPMKAAARVAAPLPAVERAPEDPRPAAAPVPHERPLAATPAAPVSLLATAESYVSALSWRSVVLSLWLTGALAVLAPLAVSLLRVRWQHRNARPVEDAAWIEALDRARADLGIRRAVELVEGGGEVMPMTWGWRRPVILLPAGSHSWPASRRRAVLLHELAHVARGDYLTQLVSEVARALHWWNPLVWRAAGKLRLESEHACDDQVLTAGARPSDYAGDLLDIARSLRALRATAPAGLAMARPSELTGRLLAVLDPRRNRRSLSRRLALPAWLVAACVVVPLAALAPAAAPEAEAALGAVAVTAQTVPAPPAPSKKPRHVSVRDMNGTKTFEWRDGDQKIKIRTEGRIELTEDWTGIARLARSAEMRLEAENGWHEQRLDVEAGDGGRPVYTWKVDGRERPFDAEGRKWLQAMLLQFIRGTGYAAPERIAAILERQGPQGVLAEISLIPSQFVKGIYFANLFKHPLGADVVERSLNQAAREIESDFELKGALTAAAGSQPLSGATVLAYAEATRTIESDFEQHQALSALVNKARLDPQSLSAVLQAARQIDSDFELATLLTEVARKTTLTDPGVRRAYVETVAEIGGDFEHHKALTALVQRGDLPAEALVAVLQSAQDIGSDFERATLLVAIAGKYPLSGAARDAYLEATQGIGSSFERQRAEAALGRQRSGS